MKLDHAEKLKHSCQIVKENNGEQVSCDRFETEDSALTKTSEQFKVSDESRLQPFKLNMNTCIRSFWVSELSWICRSHADGPRFTSLKHYKNLNNSGLIKRTKGIHFSLVVEETVIIITSLQKWRVEPVKVELMCFVVLQESIRTVFHFVLKILQQKSKFVARNRFCLLSPESFSCFPETWMKTICCCSVTKVVLLQNLSAADFSFYKFYIQINYLTSLHFWLILYFFKDFREIQIKQTADWPVSHVIS